MLSPEGEISNEEELALAQRTFDALALYDRHPAPAASCSRQTATSMRYCRPFGATSPRPARSSVDDAPALGKGRRTEERQALKRAAHPSPSTTYAGWPSSAAAVSAYGLAGLKPIFDAADHVSKFAGIDRDQLLAFRENSNQGDGNGDTTQGGFSRECWLTSCAYLTASSTLTVTEMLAQLHDLPKRERNRK